MAQSVHGYLAVYKYFCPLRVDCNFSAVCVSTQEGAPKPKRYRDNDTIIFPKDQTPLPLILPRCESRSLQAIWFDQFNWLRLNADDGTCNCAFVFGQLNMVVYHLLI